MEQSKADPWAIIFIHAVINQLLYVNQVLGPTPVSGTFQPIRCFDGYKQRHSTESDLPTITLGRAFQANQMHEDREALYISLLFYYILF